MLNPYNLLTVFRYVFTLVALVWIGSFFIQYQKELLDAIALLDMHIVAIAVVCVLVGLVPGAFAWQQLLARDLPSLPITRGILVYLRSGVGKYTPGGLLAFAIQYRLLKSEGAEVVLLLRVFAGMALAACLAAAMISLPASAGLLGLGSPYLVGMAVLIIIGAMLYCCRMKRWPWFSSIASGRLGVPPPVPFAKTVLFMTGAWILTGTHLAILGMQTGISPVFFISAYAFSAIAGIVFAVLPGAFGVRDGALVLVLLLRLDPTDAVMLAVLSRALIVAGDVIGTGASAIVLGWADPKFKIRRSFS